MAALSFIVRVILELYTYTFLLRFFMQRGRVDFRNPLAQFIIEVTNPLVRPLRRIVPGWKGLDLSTVLIAYLLVVITFVALSAINGVTPPGVGILALAGLRQLVLLTIQMFVFIIFAFVLMSWFAPHHPIRIVLEAIADPIMRPVRRIMPPIGGLDLSPLVVLIGLQAVTILIRSNFGGY